jgi:hypothetical protein
MLPNTKKKNFHNNLFYGKFAEKFLKFSKGIDFLYYAFAFNMYNNDSRQAIYAIENNKIISTFSKYASRIRLFYSGNLKKTLNHFIFIGDSHLLNYEYLFLNKFFKNFLVLFCRIQGASSYGLNKINSNSGSFKIIKKIFSNDHGNPIVFLNFGEVDCRSTLWLVKNKKKKKIDILLNDAILNYENVILLIQKKKYKEIILASVHEPVWNEKNIWTKRFASYEKIKNITKKYNQKLKILAKKLNCNYLEINDDLNSLKKDFSDLSVIKGEHHLNPQRVSKIFFNKIIKYFN